MTVIDQINKPKPAAFVVILIAFICLLLAATFAAHYLPSKLATHLPGGGVSLFRDDQELSVFHERVGFAYQHQAPYASRRIEYPLLGALYLAIPAVAALGLPGYSLGLMLLNCVTAACLLYTTYRLLLLLGRPTSLLWLFFLPGVVYFILNRFDVLPALLVQISLLMLFQKKWNWSFVLLGLSFLAKGYAILLFPVFFVYWLSQTNQETCKLWNNRALWATVGPIVLGVMISVVLAGFKNGLFPYYFQSTRGFAFGSIYTIYIVGLLNSVREQLVNIFMNVSAKIMVLAQFFVPALLYGGHAFFRRWLKRPENVINWSIIVMVIYILFSPYYSPQWLLWLAPLLVVWRPVRLAALLLIAYGSIAYLEFPVAINIFGFDSIHYNMLVLVRTVLLVGILVIVCQQIRYYVNGDARQSTQSAK